MIDPTANLSNYPNLENLFNKLDDSIKGKLTFLAITEQLKWAFNDYEQKRAIHRLHCVMTAFIDGTIRYFNELSVEQKQALIVLTILDGCKNSTESIDAFSKEGYVALKDGVPSLFYMLEKAPGIFPSYSLLSKEAKDAIKNDFFYLHLRHLQLGEVPVASISKQALDRPRQLMVAFWYANATGFSIDKPGFPIGEKSGPTISDEQNINFEELLLSLNNKNLTDYYAKKSIFKHANYLKRTFTGQEVEFISRLGKMLSFIGIEEDDKNYLQFVANNLSLMTELAALETKTFTEHHIEAFTFFPAVLKKLKENIMPGTQLEEILGVFLSLQKQLYLSIPSTIDKLGQNRTIPLFGLSNAQDDMLRKFANSSDKQGFHFEASIAGNFINVNLVDGPVLQATLSRTKAEYVI